MNLSAQTCLPEDAQQATLIARVWMPGLGPVLALVSDGALHDLSALAPTCSELLELPAPVAAIRELVGRRRAPATDEFADGGHRCGQLQQLTTSGRERRKIVQCAIAHERQHGPESRHPYAGDERGLLCVLGQAGLRGEIHAVFRGTSCAPVSCSWASTSEATNLPPWPSALASASDWCTASPTIVGTASPSARWV